MNKRHFIHSIVAAGLSLALPATFAQARKPLASSGAKAESGPASLTGSDYQGKPVKLADFAGKVCLVSFFTSGCNLCSNDLKLMREFYMNNRAKNFVLLGVNIDDGRNDFMQYMNVVSLSVPADQRFPIVWRNAPGHQDTFGAITKKPTHFVLDKDHKPVLRREGSFQPSDWDDLWTTLS